ncbi:MAG: ribonuclease III [Lachnospiraceae bacterium]|nr:ribonuclease III [Lachnospiraceae bacterium]
MEESIKGTDLLESIKKEFDLEEVDIRTYNPLTLAFIGDCVFEMIIRTLLVCKGNKSVNAFAKEKNAIVNAKTQSRMAEFLKDYFTEEEADIYRFGKNAKTANHSKSAAYNEYHKATGIEALFGYLYLTGKLERCIELIKIARKNDVF